MMYISTRISAMHLVHLSIYPFYNFLTFSPHFEKKKEQARMIQFIIHQPTDPAIQDLTSALKVVKKESHR